MKKYRRTLATLALLMLLNGCAAIAADESKRACSAYRADLSDGS